MTVVDGRPWTPSHSRSGVSPAAALFAELGQYPRIVSIKARSGVEPDPPRRLPTPFEVSIESWRRQPMQELIVSLGEDKGIPWNMIAAVVGVSRHAVSKWRSGESEPTRPRQRRICRLAAFAELLHAEGAKISEWLAAELDQSNGVGSGSTVADVLSVDRFELALAHFHGEMPDHELLEAVFPGKRTVGALSVEWEIDQLEDGTHQLLASIDALDLFAQGPDRSAVEAELVSKVSSYIDDWFSDLRRYEPHRQRRGLVLMAADALEEGRLGLLLFGA